MVDKVNETDAKHNGCEDLPKVEFIKGKNGKRIRAVHVPVVPQADKECKSQIS